ncbi:hypothetical protein [Polyangium mundeleinium]|uniref:Uncharacterized protein n=1 Tax=Polyangium mundeleinium TaxID=2995306 RepID=A0ABT5F0A2_9BACT|nr:hypothetical protein [Polyangium mundeleinium]MDC0747514.1 hypothetical protein [Polyangium mundeleinium]
MNDDTVVKYTGPALIDAQPIKDKLVDIKGGDLQGYKREKPGLLEVLVELASAIPSHGDAAGIHPNTYDQIVQTTEVLTHIRALKPAAAKLVEILNESEVYYEDLREGQIIRVAKNALDTAKLENKPGILASFEKTMKYRSQYAEKAAATRRKNEEAKGDAEPAATTTSPA